MGAAASLATLGLNLATGKRKQDGANDLIEADRVRQAQELKLQQQIDKQKRQQQLAKALASTRARAGSAGIGAFASSADAIASGLTQQSRRDQANSDAQTQLALAGNDTRAALRKRNNLLDYESTVLGQTTRTLGGLGNSLLN